MKRIPKLIKFPESLVEKIKKYQEERKIKTFSKALYLLIERGLNRKNDSYK
ncbi:hypothetical protein JOC54_000220 [Alkalihalobacillus xiaoxiensis]|uniref:CopG family transcriptional regulator n=1 Tax=Shouchella xiaoxiensis TaxID=766895 RepID=A0ABS2SN92_9BACI|nr:hypothetical protein [Shouchella xiaoxiensis]MBM7836989.1 hypothetical protein [Shouchella xiaoxiensis]